MSGQWGGVGGQVGMVWIWGLGSSESGGVEKGCVPRSLWQCGSLDLIPGAIDGGFQLTVGQALGGAGGKYSPRGAQRLGGSPCDSPQHLIHLQARHHIQDARFPFFSFFVLIF